MCMYIVRIYTSKRKPQQLPCMQTCVHTYVLNMLRTVCISNVQPAHTHTLPVQLQVLHVPPLRIFTHAKCTTIVQDHCSCGILATQQKAQEYVSIVPTFIRTYVCIHVCETHSRD